MKTEWMLKLNRYQRDNLLQLIEACGYPANKLQAHVEPFPAANTGDWLGEVWHLLQDDPDGPVPTPNVRVEDLRTHAEQRSKLRSALQSILIPHSPHT